MIMQRSVYLLEIDDGLIVVPWNCVLLVAHAKHIRAEMLNSNSACSQKACRRAVPCVVNEPCTLFHC